MQDTDTGLARGTRSREAILDASIALMARHGYSGTSISRVSAVCGLPASSIYWHFGSKEGLLSAVVARETGAFFDSLPSERLPGGNASERLTALLEMVAGTLRSRPDFVRLIVGLSVHRLESHGAETQAGVTGTGGTTAGGPGGPTPRARQVALTWFALRLSEVFGLDEREDGEHIATELARFTLCVVEGTVVLCQMDDVEFTPIFDQLHTALLALAGERGAPTRQDGSGT